MPRSRAHVVVGDEFVFLDQRSRVSAVHHDPVRGTMVELVDVTPGDAPARTVTVPLSLLASVVRSFNRVDVDDVADRSAVNEAA